MSKPLAIFHHSIRLSYWYCCLHKIQDTCKYIVHLEDRLSLSHSVRNSHEITRGPQDLQLRNVGGPPLKLVVLIHGNNVFVQKRWCGRWYPDVNLVTCIQTWWDLNRWITRQIDRCHMANGTLMSYDLYFNDTWICYFHMACASKVIRLKTSWVPAGDFILGLGNNVSCFSATPNNYPLSPDIYRNQGNQILKVLFHGLLWSDRITIADAFTIRFVLWYKSHTMYIMSNSLCSFMKNKTFYHNFTYYCPKIHVKSCRFVYSRGNAWL